MLFIKAVGNVFEENQTQNHRLVFGCVNVTAQHFRSPLMLGAELTKLDDKTLELLTNKAVYEMFQEARGARETLREEEFIVWESASDIKKYKAVFNISDQPVEVPVKILGDIDENAREIWSEREFRESKNWIIPTHGVLLFEEVQ